MRFLHKISWLLFKIFALYSFLVLILLFWTPTSHWFAGFLMMSFPAVVLVQIVFLVYFIFGKTFKAIVPFIILCLSLPFLPRTFSSFTISKSTDQEIKSNEFSLLNYNVSGFWTPYHGDNDLQAKEMLKMRSWIVGTKADVMCFPEYYTNPANERVNVDAYFKKAGYKYKAVTRHKKTDHLPDYFGLVILSKYPIVNSLDTSFSETNGLVLADIKIGKDTVRILGVHLYSMTLRLKTLLRQRKLTGVKKESKKALTSIRRGFSERSAQVEKMLEWIRTSPYPVITCGDFNETPYGYVYGKTGEMLANAFERKGEGFGFTYNELPYLIRIDNQFYDSKRLKLSEFETIDSVRYSDHYPLLGKYAIE